ncbi:MAG: hypothetical protein AB8B48_11745 [Pseudomonadales bacterium]
MSRQRVFCRVFTEHAFRARQRGSTSTEWSVATLIMLGVLFVPAGANGQSAMGFMMESLQNFHKHTTYVYSLP